MKNIFKKFISFILIVTLFLGSTINAFGNNQNILSETEIKKELEKDYRIRGEINTPYGKVYVLVDKNKVVKPGERFSIWDIADFAMAGISWAKLFNDPSWSNLGVAVVDTVGLLPLIPSLSTARNSKEALDIIAKEYKTNKKVRDKINATKKVKYTLDVTKDFISGFGKIKPSALKDIAKKYKGDDLEEIMKKFKGALDKGLVGKEAQNGIKPYNSKDFKFEVKIFGKFGKARILGNKTSDGKYDFTKFLTDH